jgi:hypothetical protein
MRYILLFFFMLISATLHALELKAGAPSRYVVQPGDSLWSIANRYLEHPWEWKTLLNANPNIRNPKNIYPGSILVLDVFQDAPFIKILPGGTIKLSPHIRATPFDKPVPPIPLVIIQPFLDESIILDQDILGNAPYVVDYVGEHMLGGQGDEVYVKGLHPSKIMLRGATIGYSIFRSGKDYIDPTTHKILGYRAKLIGYAELISGGEPATVLLTNITEGVKKADKVLHNDTPEFDSHFLPKAPEMPIKGYIIDMPGSGLPETKSQEAVGSVVVLNLGETRGLKAGDVLGIFSKPRIVPDPKNRLIPISIPPERIGEAMVFRTFTKTSFALIVRSTRAVYLLDSVSNP